MGEGELNLKELKMVNLETGQEVQVEPIKEFDIEQYNKDISTLPQLSIDEVEFRIQQAFMRAVMSFGYFLKPLTKKRTKKILMSRGYSRNDANALLEDIEHRTMSHLDKFFPKNN